MKKKNPDQPDAGLAAENRPVPSQAEGEDNQRQDRGPGTGFRPMPSQAEGDRETIEADLERQNANKKDD